MKEYKKPQMVNNMNLEVDINLYVFLQKVN